jgi:DNA adenine methylase
MQKIRPLMKYIGSKSRFAAHICSQFPSDYKTYFEPFLGSGAILGHLAPHRAIACDVIEPLIALWKLVQKSPKELVDSYTENYQKFMVDRLGTYETVKARFNQNPNPHDFLFISRTCYGGVIRFRRDGYLSTPIGPHKPIPPSEFATRATAWKKAVKNTEFIHGDYAEVIKLAGDHDIVYCDPPYVDSQKIIYGAQDFILKRLFRDLSGAKERGAFVVLSIDGVKKSGDRKIKIAPPNGLFEMESYISLGGSMLKRFWREGLDVDDEYVKDRLLISHQGMEADVVSPMRQGSLL